MNLPQNAQSTQRVLKPAGPQTAGVSKPDLTPREREVLALRVDYYLLKEISDQFGCTQQAVGRALRSARKKFGAHTEGELLRRARNMGIGS